MKIVHYINQFFAGIGGEEKADIKPEIREGAVGPGQQLEKALGSDFEIVATVICGDSYYNENTDTVRDEILEMVKKYNPDMFVSGPAFNAGRYGTAAASIAAYVKEKMDIPVVTAMYEENPGVDMHRKDVYILKTTDSAAGMRKTLPVIADFIKKLASNVEIGGPDEEGYFSKGLRKNLFREERGSKRAVNMLINKLAKKEFVTEYPMPVFDNVEPGPAIKDMSKARIALVTSGGIVPSGNPDRIESSSASKYGEYDLSNTGETAHGGYDPVYANEDPNRVTPVDVLNDLVAEDKIGSLHPKYYTTTGNGTAVASSKAFAEEIGQKLIDDNVDAVILTST